MNRRTFVKRSAASLAISAGGSIAYAIGIEPHWLEMVFRDLPIDQLPRELDGARLVQISDIHVGPRVSDEYLVRSFERVRTLVPDIVIFTGDFITHRAERGAAQFEQLRNVLSHFPIGRIATLGILGNHDYGQGWSEPAVADRVVAEAERAGMRILRNQSHAVNGLDIIGERPNDRGRPAG